MSTNSKNKINWDDILKSIDSNAIIEHEADMMSLKIAMEIEKLINEQKLTKKEFAKKLGTSPAYITQILRGDKRINMVFLAKVLQIFNYTFTFKFQSVEEIENNEVVKLLQIAKEHSLKEAKSNVIDMRNLFLTNCQDVSMRYYESSKR